MRAMRAMLVAVTMVVGSGVASAGVKYSASVYVDTASRYAAGGIGAARNSTDATQYIQCGLSAQPWYGPNGNCYARTAAGTTASCYFSANTYLEKVIMSMTADAYIAFYWNADGTCNYIQVFQSSAYEPKR